MKKYIENLRQRSHAEKSSYAFFASLLLTGLITAVWFLTIFANPVEYFDLEEQEIQNLANAGSLFDSLKAGFK